MSGTKASNQQRTAKKIVAHLETRRLPVGGFDSMYRTGWNAAIDTMIQEIKDGAHLKTVESCGEKGCIHHKGHVAAGQRLHSNGVQTWSDRRKS